MARVLGRTLTELLRRRNLNSASLPANQICRGFAAAHQPSEQGSFGQGEAPEATSALHTPHKLLFAAGGVALLSTAALYSSQPSIAFTEPAAQTRADAQPAPQFTTASSTEPQVDEMVKYNRIKERQGVPKDIILYQYEVCPFCNKVRAFLDYHKVPYRIVEVNPLTKKQLKWTTHKKVPVVLLDNDLQDDSSLILSRLAVEFEKVQPEPSKGWFSKSEKEAVSHEAVEEEIRWRRWVDKRFVQVITVNIYRNLKESWQTFNYIAEHANFNFAERQAARVAGSGLMWGISGKLIKKYGIEGDVRENLYSDAKKWVEALGPERDFMGGKEPNLADLSMFGVIRSVTGTDTFMDLMHKTEISGWYERMMAAVGPSARLPN